MVLLENWYDDRNEFGHVRNRLSWWMACKLQYVYDTLFLGLLPLHLSSLCLIGFERFGLCMIPKRRPKTSKISGT